MPVRNEHHRRARQRGNAMVEMALIMTPMMALLLAIVELSLPIFKKSTFTSAVREGCRYGITYQTAYQGTTYGSQTEAIQAVVQANAMGFLNGPAGQNQIKVRYYDPNSSPAFSEVTGTSNANRDGNILEVSVEGYTHNWMAPINWFWGSTTFQFTTTNLTIAASSADRLETLPGGTGRPAP